MTSPRVQRHRQADAARRRVRTQGKRVPRPPKQPAPKWRRPTYRKSSALAALATLLSSFAYMGSSIFWAVGACATAAAGGYVARQTYKRELAEVKRTGRPVGAPVTPPKAAPKPRSRAGDPLPAGVTPVDLDAPQRQPQPATSARKPGAGKHGPPGHEAKCTAKTKEACPYWRKANPGRAKTTKRATTRKGTK